MKRFILSCCVLWFFSCAGLEAADDTTALRYMYQLDEQGDDAHQLSVDYKLADDVWLFFGADRRHSELDTTSYSLGAAYSLNLDWRVAYHYQRWGDDDFMRTEIHRMDVTWYQDDWSLMVSPEYQRIDITFNEVNWFRIWQKLKRNDLSSTLLLQRIQALKSELEAYDQFEAYALSFNATYYGFSHVYLGLGFAKYDYSVDVRALNQVTPVRNLMLSPTTLSAMDTLLDRRTDMEIGYMFDEVIVSLYWGRFISAITHERVDLLVGNASVAVDDNKEVLFELGRSQAESADGFVYGGVGVGISF